MDKRKIHLINWNQVCKSKKIVIVLASERLESRDHNLALLTKLG